MIEQGLYQLVTTDPTIAAAVGADANGTTRAYWVLASQGATIPFLVFSCVATTDHPSMAGPTGLREGLYQISCYATTYYASRAIAKAVRSALDGYKGPLPDADATVVEGILIDKDFDHPYTEGAKGFICCAILQFRVFYSE
jgi:hypothetical protein